MTLDEGTETGLPSFNGLAQTVPINDIAMGNRYRKHLRGIDKLAASIQKVGLLHPVVVGENRILIAGERRIEACKRLGWTEIPVHIISLKDILSGQYEENTQRVDFTPSEIAAIVKKLEPKEKKEAKKRQGRRGQPRSGKLPQHGKGRVRDHIAKITGKSRRTIDKIVAVTDAADENPDLAPVVEEMDRTEKVDAAYKQVRATTGKLSEKDRRRIALWKTLGFVKAIEDTFPDATALIDGFTPSDLEQLAKSLDARIKYLQSILEVVTKKIEQEPVEVLA